MIIVIVVSWYQLLSGDVYEDMTAIVLYVVCQSQCFLWHQFKVILFPHLYCLSLVALVCCCFFSFLIWHFWNSVRCHSSYVQIIVVFLNEFFLQNFRIHNAIMSSLLNFCSQEIHAIFLFQFISGKGIPFSSCFRIAQQSYPFRKIFCNIIVSCILHICLN